MRIAMPVEHQDQPVAHLAEHYASELVKIGYALPMACYQSSKLTLREFEGARARTAEINGCQVCRAFRAARDVPVTLASFGQSVEGTVITRGDVPDEDYYRNVSNWKTYPNYSDRERIAIEYAERMGLDPRGLAVDDAFWKRMKAVFSDNDIVDLSMCIAGWMGMGRVTHVLGIDTVCSIGLPAVAAE